MGRPKGSLKTPGSGRKKGARNKLTHDTLVEIDRIKATGESPLEFLLAVMRDPDERPDRRLHAAGIAANYVHPKLSSVEHTGAGGGPVAIHVFAGFKYDDDPDVIDGTFTATLESGLHSAETIPALPQPNTALGDHRSSSPRGQNGSDDQRSDPPRHDDKKD